MQLVSAALTLALALPSIDRPAPRALTAYRVIDALTIDGRLQEHSWTKAAWSAPFVDITGDDDLIPRFETRVAVLWNDTALFIGARLEEPHVWGTLLQRDTVIFYDNDFEFFFDPDADNHRYGELEINALNTVWDLLLEKPYRDGGPAVNAWNMERMQHAVYVDGTLNNASDSDRGWSVEVCIPWKDIADLSPSPLPPAPGTTWRINFSRVQWQTRVSAGAYVKTSPREDNWVWSPMGVVNMHLPERWGILMFAGDERSSTRSINVDLEAARADLMDAYEAQKEFRKAHGRWAASEEELRNGSSGYAPSGLTVDLTDRGYVMRLSRNGGDGTAIRMGVTHEGRFVTIGD